MAGEGGGGGGTTLGGGGGGLILGRGREYWGGGGIQGGEGQEMSRLSLMSYLNFRHGKSCTVAAVLVGGSIFC